jgi:dipeptidyl aminopeptidase/acylaminoacyl peptidase
MGLHDSLDEALYNYYNLSQPVLISAVTGVTRKLGIAGNYETFVPSPDGRYILSIRIVPPLSLLETEDYRFPHVVEILDAEGTVVKRIAQFGPDQTGLSQFGWVSDGPRSFFWRPNVPATLMYLQALDGGNPGLIAAKRDELIALAAPFSSPVTIFQSEYRMGPTWDPVRMYWGEHGLLLVEEVDPTNAKVRTWRLNADDSKAIPQLLWDGSTKLPRPGDLVTTLGPAIGGQARYESRLNNGVLLQDKQFIYFRPSDSVQGTNRLILGRYDLDSGTVKMLYHSQDSETENVVSVLDGQARRALTIFESATQPPNVRIVDLNGSRVLALTHIVDSVPEITSAPRMLVEYDRGDGIHLSGMLYLPPGYHPGTRLPIIIEGYPTPTVLMKSRASAPQAFTNYGSQSIVPMITQGYGVFYADMPTGNPNDPHTTASTNGQLADDARAAIDKLVEIGVADRNRIGVVGTSYGGFMVASLLENTKLFQAGVAFSGVYNMDLTPFGFQIEERTFWQAPNDYDAISPFRHADLMNAPILLIHGEGDESAAKPIQSEKMFEALYELGKSARLVMIPYESHLPVSREGALQEQWEMLSWFDRYLKDGNKSAGHDDHAN